MELRAEFLIPAISKTLKDVVLPALDDEHQVAQEQINLAIGFLNILAQQQPIQHAYDLDELNRHQLFASDLCTLLGLESTYGGIISRAKEISAEPGQAPETIVATTRQLRGAITAMMAQGHDRGDANLSKNLSGKINIFAHEQLARERAMTAPMGFETGAQAVPAIEEQLGV